MWTSLFVHDSCYGYLGCWDEWWSCGEEGFRSFLKKGTYPLTSDVLSCSSRTSTLNLIKCWTCLKKWKRSWGTRRSALTCCPTICDCLGCAMPWLASHFFSSFLLSWLLLASLMDGSDLPLCSVDSTQGVGESGWCVRAIQVPEGVVGDIGQLPPAGG